MAPKLFRNHCKHCGRGFNTFEQGKHFCNDTCKLYGTHADPGFVRTSLLPPKKKLCKRCGTEFIVSYKTKTYCGRLCSGLHWQEAYQQTRLVKTQEKVCGHCGAKFIGTRLLKYCSKICATQKNEKNYQERLENQRAKRREKGKKPRKSLPYHILNHISERKRLAEEWDKLQ